MTQTKKADLYRMGLIALLVLATYGSILGHGFVWDDFDIIVHNPLLESLINLPRFFLTEDKVAAATGFYRPITYLSFALDRAIWGLNPFGFNLTNLLLQVATALSFYAVVRQLFGQERLALYAALLFALHPLAVETVNFHAGGRNTLLSACFALLSLYCYLKGHPVRSVLFFTLAIFSKEFALLLPAIFLFCDLRIRGEKPRLARYLPYLGAILCFLVLRSFAVEKANLLGQARVSAQLWLSPYLVLRYLVNMIFPFRLKVMYDEQTTLTVCIVSLALVAALAAAVLAFRKPGQQAQLTLAGLWFLLFLLPVINLVPIVSNTLIADRYGYFALMGFSLALASLLNRLREGVGTACVALALAAFIPVDFAQSRVWQDEVSLFSRMSQDAPQMAIGPRNLALYYFDKGDLARARDNLVAACARPDIQTGALVGAASILLDGNRPDLAEPLLLRALAREPRNPETYHLLIGIYQRRGDAELSRSYLEKGRQAIPALEREMQLQAADFAIEGENFLAKGRYRQAENMFRRALSLDPKCAAGLAGLGGLSLERGDQAAAADYLGRAAALDPGYPALHLYRSRLYRKQGRPEEASAELERYRQAQAAGNRGQR